MQNKLIIKNLHRCSVVNFESKYGGLVIECYRLKGNENYRLKIDGVDKGIARQTSVEIYNWIGEYLGVEILQEVKHEKVIPHKVENKPKKKGGQSKWS